MKILKKYAGRSEIRALTIGKVFSHVYKKQGGSLKKIEYWAEGSKGGRGDFQKLYRARGKDLRGKFGNISDPLSL